MLDVFQSGAHMQQYVPEKGHSDISKVEDPDINAESGH